MGTRTRSKSRPVVLENIVDTGTEGTKVATGTTAQRGTTAGQFRYNSTTGFFEGRNATDFVTLENVPVVLSVDVTEIASDAGGSATFVITGDKFTAGGTITFIGNSGADFTADTTTHDSSTQVTATKTRASFLNAQEPYKIQFTSAVGLSGTSGSGLINVDTSPTWNTAAGTLATIDDTDTGTHSTLSATDADGDTVAYSETGGTNITGAGLALNSSTGVISGDPTDVASSTTVSFTGRATANTKTVDRSFNIIINPVLDGTTALRAGTSAQAIQTTTGTTTNGVYWISCGGTAREIYCDMSSISGKAFMLAATFKDVNGAGTWTGSSSSSTANTNMSNYTNWHHASNWWDTTTGMAALHSFDYDWTQNRDYKSYLWDTYLVDNSSQDAAYLVTGGDLSVVSTRVGLEGSWSSSTLLDVFNDTTTVNEDGGDGSNIGDSWFWNNSTGHANAGVYYYDELSNVMRRYRVDTYGNQYPGNSGNWTGCATRISATIGQDAIVYGISIVAGAGLKYVHNTGTDKGGYPAGDYNGMNAGYQSGKSMTLWIR